MLTLEPAEYNKFSKSLEFTLRWEVGNKPNGGYTNDPNDPGGETKYGISKRYHPNVDIKNLTPEQAADIYYEEYWVVGNCNSYPLPLCTCIFDSAVNPGIARAYGFLKASGGDTEKFIQLRKTWYTNKVKENPEKQRYLSGWLNRCNDLQKFCELNQSQNTPPSNQISDGGYPDQVSRSLRNTPTQSLT